MPAAITKRMRLTAHQHRLLRQLGDAHKQLNAKTKTDWPSPAVEKSLAPAQGEGVSHAAVRSWYTAGAAAAACCCQLGCCGVSLLPRLLGSLMNTHCCGHLLCPCAG